MTHSGALLTHSYEDPIADYIEVLKEANVPDTVLDDYINALISSIVSAEQDNGEHKILPVAQFISSFHSYMNPRLLDNPDIPPKTV